MEVVTGGAPRMAESGIPRITAIAAIAPIVGTAVYDCDAVVWATRSQFRRIEILRLCPQFRPSFRNVSKISIALHRKKR